MTSAIIVAAGSSRRMGFNKLLAPLAGVPVLLRTLQAFQSCADVAEIIVVGGDEVQAAIDPWRSGLPKLTAVIDGGAERHLSVWAGIQACAPGAEMIAVHDGARPLISPAQIRKCIHAARERGAVACARPMTETLKRADAAGRITDSMDRTGAWVMETPQVFRRGLLIKAYESVIQSGVLVTDEVSALQYLGESIFVVENTAPNPKITFPADLIFAEKHLD
jgi:2-C-methyl-D-erythritol 4-phosphate cytidylyltransferase